MLKKKICVSIPLIDNELNSIEDKLFQIQKKDSDIIMELRFDYLKEFSYIEDILEKITKYKNQSIYTLRSTNEGGKFIKGEKERLDILKKLAMVKPMLLDLEYTTISKDNEMADFIDNNDIRTLISWHDFSGTPKKEELIDLIDKMRIFSNYIKIVTTAKTIDDSINIMQLYNTIDSSLNLIAFSMGELGIITRILCNIVGDSPFTYATIDKAVAPGQLTIDQMKSLHEFFHKKFIL
jgi:3-dehydroquinate dehydratase I